MAIIDFVVVLTVASGTSASFALLWRRGLRRRRLIAETWLAFYGVMLVAMLGAHSAEILYRSFAGSAMTETWAYDFRTYSLHLLAAILIWQGVTVLRAVLKATAPISGPDVTRAACVTMAMGLPLIPIQTFFGILLTVSSIVTLAVVAVARREQLPVAG